jgi:hypothetical protein
MDLLSSLIAGLIGSGQVDRTQADNIMSSSSLVAYAASHSHVRWDAAADAAPLIHRSGGVVEAVSCIESSEGTNNGDVRKSLLLRGLASISRTSNLSVNGSESIDSGALKTNIRERSIGLVSRAAVIEAIELPARRSNFVCALISGVVGD